MKFVIGIALIATMMTQEKESLVGQWNWVSYKIHGKNYAKKNVDILVLGNDGSYEKKCDYNSPEPETCQTGTWSVTTNFIQFNQAKLIDGTVPRPRIQKILRLTSDSLVISAKEGTADIICSYARIK